MNEKCAILSAINKCLSNVALASDLQAQTGKISQIISRSELDELIKVNVITMKNLSKRLGELIGEQ